MKKVFVILFLLFAPAGLIFAAATATQKHSTAEDKGTPLTAGQKQWLEEDVDAIISDYERHAFLSLKTNEEREKFIEGFWDDRDPTPGTKRNEFREEYEIRLKYVKENFNREGTIAPWKTERGRVWLALGKPQFRKRFPEEQYVLPIEFWQYRAVRDYGLPESFYVVFYQPNSIGAWRLYSPASDGPEALVKNLAGLEDAAGGGGRNKKGKPQAFTSNLPYEVLNKIDPELASASFSLIPTEGQYSGGISGTAIASSEVVIGKLENARNYHSEKREYVERILQGRPKVEVYYSLGPQDVKSDIYWFQAPNGWFLVDYAVQFAPEKFQMGQYEDEIYTSLTFDGTIQTAKGNVVVESINGSNEIKLNPQQFEKIRYSPFQYQGRRLIVPGDYKLSLIVRNNLTKAVVPVVEDLNIPNFDTAAAPYFTRLLLVQSSEQVPPTARGVKPFQFGNLVLEPLVDRRYPTNGTITFFYQLFFPEKSLPLTASDLTIEYETFQSGASVAKSSFPLSQKFNQPALVAGAISIYDSLKLTGAGFGPARIVARVRKGDKILAESEPSVFQIEATGAQTPWRLISGIPAFDSPFHKYLLAQQYIRLKQTDKANEILQAVTTEAPDNLEARLELMKLALQSKDYDKVLQYAHDTEIQYPKNKDLLWILGWTYYGKNQYDDAVRFFERGRMEEPDNIQILNILADVYQRLSKYDKSLEMIDKSLTLNPKQPELIQLKERLNSEQKTQ